VQVNTGIQSQKQYNMIAINLNGEIKTFSKIPSVWTDENGTHFNIKEGFGFLDVVTPTYDSRIEELSAIKLVGDVYTYDVIDRAIPQTLAELKTQKIDNLKSIIGSQLNKTDWFVIRQMDSGEVAPQEVIDSRAELRTQSNTIGTEIKALTTKKAVLTYNLPTFNI
jgi:hypothetical protein